MPGFLLDLILFAAVQIRHKRAATKIERKKNNQNIIIGNCSWARPVPYCMAMCTFREAKEEWKNEKNTHTY